MMKSHWQVGGWRLVQGFDQIGWDDQFIEFDHCFQMLFYFGNKNYLTETETESEDQDQDERRGSKD